MEEQNSETRRNRGKSSEDITLFASSQEQTKLEEALKDMYYLLSRGYPVKSSLALAANRYRLKTRQLLALQGMSCSKNESELRKAKEIAGNGLKGKTVYLDGFNVLILLETLLSGGYIFKGLDGCYRDISSVHGTYRKVNQTETGLVMIGELFKKFDAEKVIWIFDTPVSNSGKLKVLCYEIAEKNGFKWDCYLENSPDKYLVQEPRLVCSSDAWILNECSEWFNLGACIIRTFLEENHNSENIIGFSI
ncbi:MAG: DUF434 domain-containing protein [Flavobacterium psychrophilum]|nr:MAG: DUF434 domain-containing protein [Flavobacterium psychrophilum]